MPYLKTYPLVVLYEKHEKENVMFRFVKRLCAKNEGKSNVWFALLLVTFGNN